MANYELKYKLYCCCRSHYHCHCSNHYPLSSSSPVYLIILQVPFVFFCLVDLYPDFQLLFVHLVLV